MKLAGLIPHAGTMCLLERVESWSEHEIRCTTTTHRNLDNPLRTPAGLLAPCAIEYAAQAMAAHGALLAPARARAAPGHGRAAPMVPGYLASVRGVRLHVPRLDDIDGALQVHAERLAGEDKQVLYRFAVSDERGAPLVEGRAAVVLDTPLAPVTRARS